MGLTLTEKILKAHLVEGEMKKGTEIGIRIDQTLTQDATGTMAYLEFEAMGVPRPPISVPSISALQFSVKPESITAAGTLLIT